MKTFKAEDLPKNTKIIKTIANGDPKKPVFIAYVGGVSGFFWAKKFDTLLKLIGDKLHENHSD